MKNTCLAAIIISGGYSSRMGSFKPFLPFGNQSAIAMIINTYKSAGIKDVIVVAGYRGNEIADRLRESEVTCVQNENYAEGMFTSVIKGVKALDAGVPAFFMQPVDIPLVKRHTLELLQNKYRESPKGIIYPDFGGKKGHPPLIDCKYREIILNSNGEGGLKKILEEHSDDSIHVPVADKAVLMDMDTQADYETLLGYYKNAAPDMEECCSILNIYQVPANIVKHGRKVAEISVEILHSLESAGCSLDESALKAAAMLHDIVKQEKNHARAGEKVLQEMGYGKVGSIVGSHTDIEVDDSMAITEGDLLYLADKLVKEDKLIPIEQRFNHSLHKYKDNPEAVTKIENRRTAAYKIIEKIERATGRGFIYG
jgi:Uncharacterized MobA-related protein